MTTIPRTANDASTPPSHQPALVTALRVLRDWSHADDQPCEIDALMPRSSGDVKRRG